ADPTPRGAVSRAAHVALLVGMVAGGGALGGRVHCGGMRVAPGTLPARCRGGFFYEPTVISGLDASCEVEREEIFGPVVTVRAFEGDEEAGALANGTAYGLAATIFTRDIGRAHALASRIDAGIVWVNTWMLRDLRTPFGGAKQSGVGREGGSEALRFFTEAKNVCVGVGGR
ncbi:MAG: aldehyde dehydrogenase family protein, partial [Phycisphaerae bacterium]|nr:aldehyde dehydrogenase family protein [Phycisphaerae bacterium]